MLTLSDNARAAVHAITAEAPAEAGLRIAVGAPVGDGQAPPLTLELAMAPNPEDQILDEPGARVFVESAAAQVLGEQTLDARMENADEVSFFVR